MKVTSVRLTGKIDESSEYLFAYLIEDKKAIWSFGHGMPIAGLKFSWAIPSN